MHIRIASLDRIKIPLVKPTGVFDHDTPYLQRLGQRLQKKSYREKLLPLKLQCLWNHSSYLHSMNRRPKSYLETMAGVGLTAKIFECPAMHLNEWDCGCRKVLKKIFPRAKLTASDCETISQWPKVDLAFADFNNFTFRKLMANITVRNQVDALFSCAKSILINDCTLFYFRYGQRSFEVYSGILGVEFRSLEGYFHACADYYRLAYPGWHLTRVEYFRETSFLLFERVEMPYGLVINENKAPVLQVEISL